MATSEELIGIIGGLTDAIRAQHQSSKEVTSRTQDQIQELSQAVAELSTSVRTQSSNSASTLRLPPLSLPEFSGGECLDRFLDQISQVLSSSNVDPRFWIPYLKQQCQKDSRAFDIISSFEAVNKAKISTKTSKDEFLALYATCRQTLRAQRGIPIDQQIRTLLATYYSMHQNPSESVSNFSHRFLETQHSLEKLLPGIHSSSDGNQMELVHAFSMKLRPEIAKALISRDEPFKDLMAAIDCAKRHEAMAIDEPSSPHAAAFYSATGNSSPTKKVQREGRKETVVCRNFNRFSPSRCELPNNLCKNGYLHVCSIYHSSHCKAVNHSTPPTAEAHKFSPSSAHNKGRFSPAKPPSSATRARQPGISTNLSDVSVNVANPLDYVETLVTESVASLRTEITTSILNEVEKRLPAPPAPPLSMGSSAQDQVFGMPAVTPSAPLPSVLALDLAHRNILWTTITSCGLSLVSAQFRWLAKIMRSLLPNQTLVLFSPSLSSISQFLLLGLPPV